jgi:hypothetical protein
MLGKADGTQALRNSEGVGLGPLGINNKRYQFRTSLLTGILFYSFVIKYGYCTMSWHVKWIESELADSLLTKQILRASWDRHLDLNFCPLFLDLISSMVFDPASASHLKPWLVRTLEPMFVFLMCLFLIYPDKFLQMRC